MVKISPFFLALGLLASCTNTDRQTVPSGTENAADNIPPSINFTVIQSLPHDTSSFTEGLLFHEGKLYESTGTEPATPASRRSLFGVVDPKTGKIEARAELDKSKYFGEGISFLGDKVYQLTWTSKVGFIYNSKTFARAGEFTIPVREGWGMTTDGTHLIMSDGSSNITYVDPVTFRPAKILGVTDNNGPVNNLNELELIHGYLYANRWETNYIVKIDTASGKVVGMIDLTSLVDAARASYPEAAEMNGIAYDAATDKILITGKLWPYLYEIKFPH
ncbi:MAG: glutaminyl-peptide cyclotransferase [Bacteroidota bacterium]|nr:glutaminyl-peptide cyclotransferase [Bacteroidota bacterium]